MTWLPWHVMLLLLLDRNRSTSTVARTCSSPSEIGKDCVPHHCINSFLARLMTMELITTLYMHC